MAIDCVSLSVRVRVCVCMCSGCAFNTGEKRIERENSTLNLNRKTKIILRKQQLVA